MTPADTSVRSRSSLVVLAAVLAAVVLGASPLIVACGLADDDTLEFIPPDEIPFGLDQTTTTTTTTTTTLAPDRPVEPTLPTTTTTTLTPVQTAPVEVYFVIGLEQLQRQTVQFSFPVEPLQVLAQLEDGPQPDVGIGLRTALRPNLTAGYERTEGVATVDLRGSVLNRTSSRDQNLAIAQLVLTVGRLPGVGQVRFTIDGDPVPIPVPPSYTLSDPGEPLSYETFAVLLTPGSGSSPVSTTTTTSVPPTNPPTSPPATSPTTTSEPTGDTEPPDVEPDTDAEPDEDQPAEG